MSEWAVTMRGSYLGQSIVNTIAIRGPGDVPAGVQGNEVARRVRNAWVARLLPILSSQLTLLDVTAVSMTNPAIVGTAAGSSPGGWQASEPITGAVCVAVDILTGFRGKSFRGRTGLAGLVESKVAGNFLLEGDRLDFDARFAGFRADLSTPVAPETEVLVLGVISRFSGKVKRPVPVFTPATSTVVRGRVGTRVSRLR